MPGPMTEYEMVRERIAQYLYGMTRQGSINMIAFAKAHGIELDSKHEPTEPLPEWDKLEPTLQQISKIQADQILNLKDTDGNNLLEIRAEDQRPPLIEAYYYSPVMLSVEKHRSWQLGQQDYKDRILKAGFIKVLKREGK